MPRRRRVSAGTAPVFRDGRVNQFYSVGLEACISASLIKIHQPRTTHHIGGEDRF